MNKKRKVVTSGKAGGLRNRELLQAGYELVPLKSGNQPSGSW